MVLDPWYFIIVGPAFLLTMAAQWYVHAAFDKWSKVPNRGGMTGAEAAWDMLRRAGVSDVRIERIDGTLTDHYAPGQRVLRLSQGVHDGRSVAALGIACHEAGHALQHTYGYTPLGLRSLTVPVARFGSSLGPLLFMIGMALAYQGSGTGVWLVQIGLVLFSGVVLFQIITLPVEFNASSRATEALQRNGIIEDENEVRGVNEVLNAAALTYVAAALQGLLTLLYFIMRFRGMRRG